MLAVPGAALEVRPGAASNAFARDPPGPVPGCCCTVLSARRRRSPAAVIIEPLTRADLSTADVGLPADRTGTSVTSQILRGSSTTQIATELHISPHTVNSTSRASSIKPACESARLGRQDNLRPLRAAVPGQRAQGAAGPTGTRRPCVGVRCAGPKRCRLRLRRRLHVKMPLSCEGCT